MFPVFQIYDMYIYITYNLYFEKSTLDYFFLDTHDSCPESPLSVDLIHITQLQYKTMDWILYFRISVIQSSFCICLMKLKHFYFLFRLHPNEYVVHFYTCQLYYSRVFRWCESFGDAAGTVLVWNSECVGKDNWRLWKMEGLPRLIFDGDLLVMTCPLISHIPYHMTFYQKKANHIR